MNKKVLFIAYHFPPDAAVGALRTQKFVKYLPDYGWEPYVLTVRNKFYANHDYERMEDVKSAIVKRTSFWRTPLQLFIDFRDNYIRKLYWKNMDNKDKNNINLEYKFSNENQMAYIKRFFAGINHLPDDMLYWLIPGLYAGVKLVNNAGINIIVVSSPPKSSIIFAYLLSMLTSSKLIIDYRDPWTLVEKSSVTLSFKPESLLNVERYIEKMILKRTSYIITTNEFLKKLFLKSYSFLSTSQVNVIQNGFDSDDLQAIESKINEKYIIAYLGTFYLKRNPNNFLKALSCFMEKKCLDEKDIEVRFVGHVERAEGDSVGKMVQDSGLERVVKIMGRVSHSKALELMRESNLLLLLAPNQPYQIPAKAYEYIAAQRPILALTEKGATASLIKNSKCGLCVEPFDIEGINQALDRFFDDYLMGKVSFVCDISQFERRKQTLQLSVMLDEVYTSNNIEK